MRAVCIARHRYLSEHIASVFADIDVHAVPAVGFEEGIALARRTGPSLVLCEYDLLAMAPLHRWERDRELGAIPIIAVSLTRRPEEAHLADTNGIAGFLYLPTLSAEDAWRVLHAATGHAVRPPGDALAWRWGQPRERRP